MQDALPPFMVLDEPDAARNLFFSRERQCAIIIIIISIMIISIIAIIVVIYLFLLLFLLI